MLIRTTSRGSWVSELGLLKGCSISLQCYGPHLGATLAVLQALFETLVSCADVSSLVAEAGILMDSLTARQQQYTCTINENVELCQSHRATTQELINLQASNLRLRKFSAEPVSPCAVKACMKGYSLYGRIHLVILQIYSW